MDSSPPSIDPSLPSTDSSLLAFPLLDNLPLNCTTHKMAKKKQKIFCHTRDMGRNTFLYKTHSTKQLVMKNKFKWNIRSKFWKWNVYNDSCQNGVSTCATCYWGRMCEVQREDLPREQHHMSSGMESIPPGWHRHWPQLCGSKISARTNPVSRHRSRRRHFRGWRRCGRSRRGSSGHWPCWREACGSGTSVV